MTHRLSFHVRFIVFFAEAWRRPEGKNRVRGGVAIQQQKQNQRQAEERKAADEHSRTLTMRLRNITEKALGKLPS